MMSTNQLKRWSLTHHMEPKSQTLILVQLIEYLSSQLRITEEALADREKHCEGLYKKAKKYDTIMHRRKRGKLSKRA